MRSRITQWRTVVLTAVLLASIVAVPTSVGAASCKMFNAKADISQMDPEERATYDKRGCNVELVDYQKVFVPIEVDGTLGAPQAVATSTESGVSTMGAGTDDHGLYLSLSASRNIGTGYCVDYTFNGYFKWTVPPPSPDTGYDFWGITWNGNVPYPNQGAAYGIMNNGVQRNHYAEDILPAEGIVWRFRDWDPPFGYWMRYGYSAQSIRKKLCTGTSTSDGNAALKYVHTQANLNFSASVTAGSPASFSVSPGTEQWKFAVAATFNT